MFKINYIAYTKNFKTESRTNLNKIKWIAKYKIKNKKIEVDSRIYVITFVTTPGTEFSTGKSNDLWILKNFEKHDILSLYSQLSKFLSHCFFCFFDRRVIITLKLNKNDMENFLLERKIQYFRLEFFFTSISMSLWWKWKKTHNILTLHKLFSLVPVVKQHSVQIQF